MFTGNFTNFKGNMVGTLGNNRWCIHGFPFITDGNRQVGRVGNNDIGLGNLRHHPAPCLLHLHGTDARFELRVALGLFMFFLDLLLGHFHLLFHFVSGKRKIDNR